MIGCAPILEVAVSYVRDERLLSGPSHPICISATGLLLLNDHVLKAAYGNVWTGKISDVCWLIVAPVVLAAVLHTIGLKSRVARGSAMITVAAFFTALQIWAPLGDTITAWIGGTSVADPTDLLALPALVLVPRCWRKTRTVRPILFGVSLFAVVATEGQDGWDRRYPCDEAPAWDPNVPLFIHFETTLSQIPVRSPSFRSAIRVYGPNGEEVDTFVEEVGWRGTGDVAICPDGGLKPNTQYTWTVGPFKNTGNNSINSSSLGSQVRGSWSFVTDDISDNSPITSAAACRGVHSDVYDALGCDTEPDSGLWDTGDTGQ
jgi:hypothetical protein